MTIAHLAHFTGPCVVRSCPSEAFGETSRRGEEVRVKIPRRLNAALDWAADHARVMLVVLPLAIAAVTTLWIPVVAAFAVGMGVGGVAVHLRMSAKVARLRAEADDLLRENGALRHQKTVIAKATVASGSLLTQKLPIIPDRDDQ
jgi:hypothetical protein